jgi:uncharacterized protein (DUF302 family)
MTAGHEARLAMRFDAALERVAEALSAEGFGIISRIDLDRAFAEKLGLDFRRYAILGACNPELAHAVLTAVPEAGLLLPCNVTVEEEGDSSVVRLAAPEAMAAVLGAARTAALAPAMAEAAARLGRVAEALGARAMD